MMYGHAYMCPHCGSDAHWTIEPSVECIRPLQERVALLAKTATAHPLTFRESVLMMLDAMRIAGSAHGFVERLNTAGVFFVRVDKPD